jgi:hypothetical protein
MRTTIRLDDALMRRAKRFAAARGTTLTQLFESAVREKLLREQTGSEVRERIPLPTFSGRGLQPGVDLHDTAALLDLMDGADS